MQLTEDIIRSPAAPCLAYLQCSGVGEDAAPVRRYNSKIHHFVFTAAKSLEACKLNLGTVRPQYGTGVSLLSRERFLYI